jgi:hypothetical protein
MRTTDPKRQSLVPPTPGETAATAARFERRGPLQRLRRLPAPDPQPTR